MCRLAVKMLIADRGKLVTALAGVVFSLVLINIQGGLFLGLMKKASLLIDRGEVDIWVGQRGMRTPDLPGELPIHLLDRVRGLSGVAEAEPYIVKGAVATLPDGGFETVLVVGSDPRTLLGSAWSYAEGSGADLRRPEAIAIDVVDEDRLAFAELGDLLEINGVRARVSAKTEGTQNFITTPIVFTELDSARRYLDIGPDYCSWFRVRLADGADPAQVCEQVRERLPEQDVYTAEEFRQVAQSYWLRRTGIGLSFGAATLLGLTVGLLIVAQSLYALALDHLPEYAALKAMGAENGSLCGVVIMQAATVAAIGCAVGVALVLAARELWSSPHAPIHIPLVLLLGGAVVVSGFCLAAAVLPFRRICRVDPVAVLHA